MEKLEDKYFEKLRLTFPEKFLTDRSIKLLLNACPDEAHLKVLSFYLGHLLNSSSMHKEKGRLLFDLADESYYDLTEWIKAIKVFDDYLNEHKRTTKFELMLEYISCSCQSPENKLVKYPLHDLVKKMLDEYGYVG